MQKIKVYLKTRLKLYNAIAEYENGIIIVKKGSQIKNGEAINFKFPLLVKETWDNKDIVGKNNILLKNIEFDSPSAAAQFVTKNSVNGWKAWKTEDGIELNNYRGK